MTTKILTKVDGVIDTTIEASIRKYKSSGYNHELRIFLQDTSEYFRFMDIYHYNLFRQAIKRGDNAEIFIRPKWLVPLGLGYRNDIFQMTINGKTVFDISQTRRNSGCIIIICLLAVPGFIILGRYGIRKKI